MDQQVLREWSIFFRKYWSEICIEANKFGNFVLFLRLLQVWLVNNWDYVQEMNINLALTVALFVISVITIWVQITVARALGVLSNRIRLMELKFLQLMLPLLISSYLMIAGYCREWFMCPLVLIFGRLYSTKVEECMQNISEEIELDINADYLRKQTRRKAKVF